jgi:hypothetical protein
MEQRITDQIETLTLLMKKRVEGLAVAFERAKVLCLEARSSTVMRVSSTTSSWQRRGFHVGGGKRRSLHVKCLLLLLLTCIFAVAESVSALDAAHWMAQTVTTAGFGDVSPRTTVGRVVACIVALLCPVLASDLMSEAHRAVGLDPRGLSALACTVGGVVSATALALVVSEGWSPAEALYFTIIAIATVGYGDLAPVSAAGKCATSLALLFGIVPAAKLSQRAVESLDALFL